MNKNETIDSIINLLKELKDNEPDDNEPDDDIAAANELLDILGSDEFNIIINKVSDDTISFGYRTERDDKEFHENKRIRIGEDIVKAIFKKADPLACIAISVKEFDYYKLHIVAVSYSGYDDSFYYLTDKAEMTIGDPNIKSMRSHVDFSVEIVEDEANEFVEEICSHLLAFVKAMKKNAMLTRAGSK